MTQPDDPELREPDLPRTAKVRKQALRTGWTTGTCAAAAAKAATTALAPARSRTPWRSACRTASGSGSPWTTAPRQPAQAEAVVVKDAGDDPDVTHGARLTATVRWRDEPGLELDGGVGVGVVTKPGLGPRAGRPRHQPGAPRDDHPGRRRGRRPGADKASQLVISVPDGERMARKTTNARLGIIGGISILGTTGIVRPFSTASWRASVEQAISVLAAQGEDTVVLCTGGRTEKGAMKLLPDLPEVCFVEVGDFTGAALRRAVEHHLKHVVFAGMAGKLTKLAAGVLMTHYTRSKVDLALLGGHHPSRGRRPRTWPNRSRSANTARHAAELWDQAGLLPAGGPRAVRPRRPRAQPVQRRGSRTRKQRPQPSASSWSTSPARQKIAEAGTAGGGMSPTSP